MKEVKKKVALLLLDGDSKFEELLEEEDQDELLDVGRELLCCPSCKHEGPIEEFKKEDY